MKKLTYFLILVVLFGCSSDSGDSGDCGAVSLTSVSQEGSTLHFNYQSSNNFNYYEIGYDVSSNLNGQNPNTLYFNNSFTTTDVSSTSITAGNLNNYAENNSTLSFYIRAQCENGNLTSWQGPIVLQIEAYCEEPYDLNAEFGTFYWDTHYNSQDPSYFQVEYGLQGFNLGNGTTVTANQEYTSEMSLHQGNTYDFYVRSYCGNNLGYSNWVGPVSLYAEEDFNACNPPSNVSSIIVTNYFGDPVGVRFEWDMNGESNFEHVLVNDGASPESGSINTSDGSGWPTYTQGLYLNTPYDFYIRAVCIDGSKTDWVGPKNVYISG